MNCEGELGSQLACDLFLQLKAFGALDFYAT